MKKFTVNDAATYFGVSKEAIHNRIRRGSLESVIEDGIKMVIVDDSQISNRAKRAPRTPKVSTHDDRYYKLLEEQNAKLQARVEVLEGETRSLRDQKELMLIEERKKIESIYKEKDEQLKNILNTISSQFALSTPQEITQEPETLEAEIEEVKDTPPISLKKYLKSLELTQKKMQKVKMKFKKRAKKDERIAIIDGKLYINTSKYNYRDLL